jgi:hypothetical protein
VHHRFALACALVVVSAITLPAQAPRPAIAPGNTVLMAAYSCAPDQLARADAIIAEASAPILNKYVASGKIISWGYLGAVLGSAANRHVYVWASDPVALMQARQAYLPEIQAQKTFGEFSKICGAATVTLHKLLQVSAAPSK